jgi:predicted MPP superfamily phosphohydrolase
MPAVRLILTLVFLLDAYWWYSTDRRLRPLRRSRPWRTLLAVFAGTLMLLLLSRVVPPRFAWRLNRYVPLPLIASVYLWHLAVLPIWVLLSLAGRGLPWLWPDPREDSQLGIQHSPPRASPHPSPIPAAVTAPSRRQFLTAATALTPPIILSATTGVGLYQLGRYRIRNFDLKIPNLPAKLEGLVIAHLSDFHAGRLMTADMMRPIIDATNDLNPDMVLITGDLIDYALADLPFALDAVRRLRPRLGFEHGVAMCVGNHDAIENRFNFKKIVDDAGVPLMVNTARTLDVHGQFVQLLGINWDRSEAITNEMVRQASQVRDPAAFPIVLAHHPHAFDEAARMGLPLTLSGHTHGGQVMFTDRVGAGSLMFRYWSGLYAKYGGESQLVVSNGIGNWFPLRVNAPAEILRLTLGRA